MLKNGISSELYAYVCVCEYYHMSIGYHIKVLKCFVAREVGVHAVPALFLDWN